jgi:polar amino acid transport system substrate-binding protein
VVARTDARCLAQRPRPIGSIAQDGDLRARGRTKAGQHATQLRRLPVSLTRYAAEGNRLALIVAGLGDEDLQGPHLEAAHRAAPARADDAAIASARASLPDEMKAKGVLVAGMPLDYEPYTFVDDKNQPVGIDVDLIADVAKILGLKLQIQRIGFASLIPALQGGRIDVGMAGMGILPARLKVVSFVRYGQSQNGLVVRKGNPTKVSNLDACGHSIALEKGTTPLLFWEDVAKKCLADNKPKIDVMVFDGEGPQMLAVESGRAEAGGLGYATTVSVAKHSDGKLEVAAGGAAPGPALENGIPFKKDNVKFGAALEAAMKIMVADGRYDAIFAKWDVSPLRAPVGLVTGE